MATLSSHRLLVFALAASLFSFALPPVHGDDDPWGAGMSNAHDLLIKAHDETDAAARKSELEKAREIIRTTAPLPMGKARRQAVSLISSALSELKQGDPNNLVNRYIEQANRNLGY